MRGIVEEEQALKKIDNEEISDATSTNNKINSRSSDRFECFARMGLTNIDKQSLEYTVVTTCLFSGMGRDSELAKETRIVAVHKILKSSLSEARAHSFAIFLKAVAERRGGDANLKYGWFGASREEICEIVTHGFSWCNSKAAASGGQDRYRHSICLSSARFSLDCVLSSKVDENGVRHLLLCRLILGNQEVVTPDSKQCVPSSPDFDSGVDDLSAPTKYYIWSAYMNSHILPCYVISFQAPYLSGAKGLLEANAIQPRSPLINFPTLISMLSQHLGPREKASLDQQYRDFREKKITRQQLIDKVKEIAGNQLLTAVVTLYIYKGLGGSGSSKEDKQEGHAKGR